MRHPEFSERRWIVYGLIGIGGVLLLLKFLLAVWLMTRPADWFGSVVEVNRSIESDHGKSVTRGIFDWVVPLSDGLLPGRWQALPLQAPYPEDHVPSIAKIALGEALFFDEQLSRDGTVSCSSCHKLSKQFAGADGLRVSEGINGSQGSRNAPTVYNAAFQSALFWDGRAGSLEEQAKGPFVNPAEMGMPSLAAVEARVWASPHYRRAFAAAFPRDLARGQQPTIDHIVKAIAAYERTLITPHSPYDRFVRGDREALSAAQQRGMALFRSAGCAICHSGPNFSAASVFAGESGLRPFPVHNNRRYEQRYGLTQDLGLNAGGSGTGNAGIWRVPSLRNVALTAPYFHNGSVATLEEAVRVMARLQLNKGVDADSNKDWEASWSDSEGRFYVSENLTLSDRDIADLVSFLESLSGL